MSPMFKHHYSHREYIQDVLPSILRAGHCNGLQWPISLSQLAWLLSEDSVAITSQSFHSAGLPPGPLHVKPSGGDAACSVLSCLTAYTVPSLTPSCTSHHYALPQFSHVWAAWYRVISLFSLAYTIRVLPGLPVVDIFMLMLHLPSMLDSPEDSSIAVNS